MNSAICVDSSFVIKLLIDEEGSKRAASSWDSWLRVGVEIVAPTLLAYEVTSVLRTALHRRRVSEAFANEALREFFGLSIAFHESVAMHQNAFLKATSFGLGAAYDAHYLALAAEIDCEFWTADARLFNATAGRFPLIRLLSA
jgi:predicted nucleic acid-binding protein